MNRQADICIESLSVSDNRKKQKARDDIQHKYSQEPDLLFNYLSHPDWKVRYEIFKVLLSFGKRIIPVLVQNLRHQSEDVFYWVCRLVSHYKDIRISKVLVELVEDESVSLVRKKQLVDALSYMNDERSVLALVRLFNSDYWVLRRQSSDGIFRRIGKKTLSILLSVEIDSEHVEYWLARTLLRFDRYHHNTEKFFINCLKSKNEEVIKLSLSYFEQYQSRDVIKHLLSLLNHELWSIKRMTAEILCEYGKSVIPDLEKLIKVSTNDDEKYWISRILGEIPISNRKLGAIMSRIVTDSSPYIRSSAILNIGKSGIRSELHKILRFVDDSNVEVRKNLAIALGENPSDEKINAILKALMDDPDEWVRHYARMSYERTTQNLT